MAEFYDRGELPPTVRLHQQVAAHYRIPGLNMGRAIWEEIHAGKAAWQEMLPDNTHPSDAGMAIYAAQIREFLEEHRKDAASGARALPPPLTVDPLEDAHMVEVTDVETAGWKRDDETAARFFPHSIAASVPGTELHYSFEGTAVGFFWVIAPDSGDMEWSVDGAPAKRASSWDSYALRFTRKNYTILDDSLPPGRHELTVRVLGEHNPQSQGTAIRIGWLLVNGLAAKQ
jgi:hypothetical protein